jgi:hypothetical protein
MRAYTGEILPKIRLALYADTHIKKPLDLAAGIAIEYVGRGILPGILTLTPPRVGNNSND